MNKLEHWILPSKRQMIAKCIEDLAAAGRIKTAYTDDDMLWCTVNMTQPSDSVLATLGIILMSWGPPILVDKREREALYLFSPLQGRIRDRVN